MGRTAGSVTIMLYNANRKISIVPSHSNLERFFKLGVGLLAWMLLGWMLLNVAEFLLGIVILFGFSFLFTYILLAPVNAMELVLKRGLSGISGIFRLEGINSRIPPLLPRAMAILMVYLAFGLCMLVVSVRFVPVAIDQLNQFSNELPRYTHQAEEWILNLPVTQDYFHQEVTALKSSGMLSEMQKKKIESEIGNGEPKSKSLSPTEKEVIREKVFDTPNHINRFVKEHISGTLGNLWTVVSTTLTGFVYMLTGLVLVFYFLLDGRDLKDKFVQMLPRENRRAADYLLTNMHTVMFAFIKGQVILGVATGIYMIVVYSFFDVPYAFFLGAFFAVAEILPVVGTWLGFTPGILVLLFINPLKLLVVMGLVYFYQVIKDNLVAPRVIGQVMGLHPVIVILSLLVCAKVAGLVGILFAIPLASMINVLLRYFQEQEQEHPYA